MPRGVSGYLFASVQMLLCWIVSLLLATVGGEDAVTIALEERRWPELDHRD